MATQEPYTLADLQAKSYVLDQNDTSTPAAGDDEYIIALSLFNNAIQVWANENEVEWNELWRTNTNGGTVTAGTVSYSQVSSAPSFKFPGGWIRLVSGTTVKKIPVIKPEEAQLHAGVDNYQCYFTGSPAIGYTLNLCWTPVVGGTYTGYTIQYDYYKFPDELVSDTDKPEMSDPMFIVYWAVAQLKRMSNDSNGYAVMFGQAQNSLANMRTMNAKQAIYQDNMADDLDYINGNVIGE